MVYLRGTDRDGETVFLETAADLGLGVSSFISLGNKADVSGNDLLEYWAEDPRTKLQTEICMRDSLGPVPL